MDKTASLFSTGGVVATHTTQGCRHDGHLQARLRAVVVLGWQLQLPPRGNGHKGRKPEQACRLVRRVSADRLGTGPGYFLDLATSNATDLCRSRFQAICASCGGCRRQRSNGRNSICRARWTIIKPCDPRVMLAQKSRISCYVRSLQQSNLLVS